MGLLDVLGKIVGGGTSSSSGGSQDAIVNVISGLLSSKETGGLAGLVENFTKAGLGDVISSWVSTGKNLPVSADQIVKGLGNDQVKQLASQVGLSSGDLSSTLAKMLPDIVDKLTPNGKVPTDDLLQQGLNLLKGNLKL